MRERTKTQPPKAFLPRADSLIKFLEPYCTSCIKRTAMPFERSRPDKDGVPDSP